MLASPLPDTLAAAPFARSSAPDATLPAAGDATPPARRTAFTIWRWLSLLGGVGFLATGATAGTAAFRMGYSLQHSAAIAALAGITGATVTMSLLPLARAIRWTLFAAALLLVGVAALYALSEVAPAFVDSLR